jgi:F0F1-type ATP synthase epsilon subunit
MSDPAPAKAAEKKEEPKEAPKLAVDKDGKPIMAIKVFSPFKTYFDESGYSVSAQNNTGPFDILPRHHNFITLLNPGDLVIRPINREEQRFRISGGMMHVKADQVAVFLDI